MPGGVGDFLRPVRRGEPLRFSADLYNRLVKRESANRLDDTTTSQRHSFAGGDYSACWVKNVSGQNRDRFEILGIQDSLLDPTSDNTPDTWAQMIAVEGVTPTTPDFIGYFVVLQEPISNNAVGRALAFGVTPAWVNFGNADDGLAEITNNDATQLTSGSSGSAQILANPSGDTGKQLAVVRLGNLTQETVLVAIIGTETGGGYYKGSILSGNSNAGGDSTHSPGYYNFQLQASNPQSYVDGPAAQTTTVGALVNNALVVNVFEQYSIGSHLLYCNESRLFYALGKVMGQTTESTPRQIVYIQSLVNWPVVVLIDGWQEGTGSYYGKIVQGLFGSNDNNPVPTIPPPSSILPGADDCWLVNIWESLHSGQTLPSGTLAWGILVGYGGGAIPGSSQATYQPNYVVYSWLPTKSYTLTDPIQNILTTQTAGGVYSSNEQNMLNDLRQDVVNLQASLKDMLTKLQNAGYAG